MEEKEWLFNVLKDVIAIDSINPENEGPGEKDKIDYLESLVKEMGYNPKRYDIEDDRHGKPITRSNLIVKIKGLDETKTIWVIAHVDTVGFGDLSKWKIAKDPLKVVRKGDIVYGRGVNDNGIGIMSSLLLLKRFKEKNMQPRYNLGIAFLADEEAGSTYGLKWILENTSEFNKGDFAIVPDAGSEKGDWIEVAEKGILWLKVTVNGKQTHASTPGKGINAHLEGMRFNSQLYDLLHEKYNAMDELFDPPESTFEPTMKEKNVNSKNVLPGSDVVYWDCRVLPEYSLDDVLKTINDFAKKHVKSVDFNWTLENGTHPIVIDTVMREDASKVDPNSWIVKALVETIKKTLKVEPKVLGIGGGTFAGILRKQNIDSVVWSVQIENPHEPDEHENINNYIKTANVIQELLLNQ